MDVRGEEGNQAERGAQEDQQHDAEIAASAWFFFSSRRRHTRCSRDWSSDVCSSDLVARPIVWLVRVNLPMNCSVTARPRCTSCRAATLSSGRSNPSPSISTQTITLEDRKSVVEGKRGDLGGGRIIKKKKRRYRVQ